MYRFNRFMETCISQHYFVSVAYIFDENSRSKDFAKPMVGEDMDPQIMK